MGRPTKKSKNGKAAKKRTTGAALPLAALYRLDDQSERGAAVREVLASLGIRTKTVGVDNLADPVGSIAGLVGFRRAHAPFEGEIPECEFMLLANVSNNLLNQLLEAMREANCSVACKAQVTQHNRLWPFGVLVGEVSREHDAMTAAE